MSTEQFYDALAESYHTLYPDWRREASAQGESLDRLIGRWHRGGVDVADVACGIGTQVIGLAALGHRVVGSDTSARAVARAGRECAAAGVPVRLAVADMRALPFDDGCVDVVVCADNALPHLLSDDDVLAALTEMRRVLRPGGTAVVTTRDYDRLLVDRPSGTLPQVFESAGERVISLQLWAWRAGTDVYDLEHVQVHERARRSGDDPAPRDVLPGVHQRRARGAGPDGRPARRRVAPRGRDGVLPAGDDRAPTAAGAAERLLSGGRTPEPGARSGRVTASGCRQATSIGWPPVIRISSS